MDKDKYIAIVLVIIVFLGSIVFIIGYVGHSKYQEGYIDAAKDFYEGKLKVNRVEKTQVVWEKK